MIRKPHFGSSIDNGDVVAIIPLTQNQHTIISPLDLGKVDGSNWHASKQNTKYKSVYNAAKMKYFGIKNGKKIRKVLRMHRIILNAPKELQVDHINGLALDNCRSNLRLVTNRQNSHNRHHERTSKYPGVNWHKPNKKWKASIWINGKKKHLGYFKMEEEASRAYQKALKHLDESFRPPFPEEK